jgi:nucleoside-diphosphate-sugar epimerase
MTALVTGAAGFVGRRLVEELLAAGTATRPPAPRSARPAPRC